MKLTKGDRVTFVSPRTKQPGYGVVTSAGAKIAVITDELRTLSGPAAAFKPSAMPISEKLAGFLANSRHEKGQRVEFESDGKVHYGVVAKGGETVVVVLDGGKAESSGPAGLYRKSSQPLAADPPSAMDRWAVAGYRETKSQSQETPCFTATITYSGKPVLLAGNDGRGGPNFYHLHPRAPKETDWLSMLCQAARAWATHFGNKSLVPEPEGDWLDWHVAERPYGVTAQAHFEEWEALISKH